VNKLRRELATAEEDLRADVQRRQEEAAQDLAAAGVVKKKLGRPPGRKKAKEKIE
jgi:hypothetical protein